jgi:hypothetical protein
MITVEEAIKHLYEKNCGVKYKTSAYWTTAREFTPSFEKIPFRQEFQQPLVKEQFRPSEIPQLVPPKGIKPLSPRS